MSTIAARAQRVAEQLQGSCQDPDAYATEEELEQAAFFEALDEHVFRCDTCSWWCELSEMSETDQVCEDCA